MLRMRIWKLVTVGVWLRARTRLQKGAASIMDAQSLRIALVLTLAGTSMSLLGCGGGSAGAPCPENAAGAGGASDVPLSEAITAPRTLQVQSTDFVDGQPMPVENSFSGFGCTGQNKSPSIAWSGAPPDTKSYAIVAHDPDAPTGVGFFHWLVFDIPATTTSLGANAATSLPEGVQSGHTDFGAQSYGGPCPPPGSPHRYIFTVYALDVPSLEMRNPPSGALLRFMLAQHTLAYGRLTGTFQR